MRVLVIGANGKTGFRVVELLVGGDHEPVAMIRDPRQAERFEALGVGTVVADLEQPLDPALVGCEGVIFAAGSGSSTGPEKTLAVDRDGAVASIAAVESAGIERYIMLSSMRADPASEGHAISHYYRAKGVADRHLARSDLDFSIVRPGRLSDEEGTGEIDIAESLGRRGSITRDDLARVLVRCLDEPRTIRRTFEVLNGRVPIDSALSSLGASGGGGHR